MSDYYSQQIAAFPTGLTMPQAYQRMTDQQPLWLTLAFRLRDLLGRPFGIQPINGGDGETVLTPGQYSHFFAVEEVADHRLAVSATDHHLRVDVELMRSDTAAETFTLTTRVNIHNLAGWLYMLPVGLAHPPICRSLLRKAARP